MAKLPSVGKEYSERQMIALVRQLEIALAQLEEKTRYVISSADAAGLPSSATGLKSGQLYVDVNGFVKRAT